MARSKQGDGSRPPGAGDAAMSPQVQARYRAVRQAMLDALPTEEPGLTFEQLVAVVAPTLPRGLFPKGPGFYPMAVRAHLESIGLICRVEKSRPQRLIRSTHIDFA
jgi:hypothetical protein